MSFARKVREASREASRSPKGFFATIGVGAAVAIGAVAVWLAVKTKEEVEPEPAFLLPPSGSGSTDTGYINGKAVQLKLTDIGNGKRLRDDAARAYLAMREAAARDGVTLSPSSAFRSMGEQQALYILYQMKKGNLAAKPGYSNHQGGISLDLNTGSGVSGYLSRVYRWLWSNASKFGFKNDVSGEPWHWTYYGATA